MRRYEPTGEIQFAAKSGFLTRGLWHKYLCDGSNSWRHKLWASFIQQEYFKEHYSSYAKDVIVPNPKNELVKKLAGDEISSPPYISQMVHDEMVAGFVLGLQKDGLIGRFRFEPELKKLDPNPPRYGQNADRRKFPDAVIE